MFPAIDPSTVGTTGLLWLFLSYGYLLFWASNLISEGSDLLMLVPAYAGLVGGVVLPILGAVPDGAIMLFSGLGSLEKAQETLSIGIGSLAGSTIMLMTIPFALSVYTGRVDLDPDPETGTAVPNYMKRPKLTPDLSASDTLWNTGVQITKDVKIGGYIVMVTSIPFYLIQIPGMFIRGPLDEVTPQIAQAQKYWALSGFVICIVFFVGYLFYQVQQAGEGVARMKRVEATKKQLLKGKISLTGAFYEACKGAQEQQQQQQQAAASGAAYQSVSKKHSTDTDTEPPKEVRDYLKDVLLEPFHIYDANGNGNLDKKEFKFFLRDFHESIQDEDVNEIYARVDKDGNGVISFDEFVDACYTLILNYKDKATPTATSAIARDSDVESGLSNKHQQVLANGLLGPDEDAQDEVEEVPEDISHLSPEAQQSALKKRALITLMIGTSLAVLFSDPLVGVLDEMATRLSISPFYVAFVLAPLGSNASEVIASRYYAAKKTRKSITVSLTALEGAGAMSNTFCLSIFMGLVYFRGLAWSYTAETIAIVVVEYALAFMVQKDTLTTFDALTILSFYPLSLVFVATLEHFGID